MRQSLARIDEWQRRLWDVARAGTLQPNRPVAIEAGKCASLISRLVAFKQLYDADATMQDVLPSMLSRYPLRYAGYKRWRLGEAMHGF